MTRPSKLPTVLRPTPLYVMLRVFTPTLLATTLIVLSLLFSHAIWYALSAVAVGVTVYRFFYLSTLTYDFSDTRITYCRGVLSRDHDFLEWYRIKDYKVQKPLLLRLVGAMNIILYTSDLSHPIFCVKGIQNNNIAQEIGAKIDLARAQKRVYEVD